MGRSSRKKMGSHSRSSCREIKEQLLAAIICILIFSLIFPWIKDFTLSETWTWQWVLPEMWEQAIWCSHKDFITTTIFWPPDKYKFILLHRQQELALSSSDFLHEEKNSVNQLSSTCLSQGSSPLHLIHTQSLLLNKQYWTTEFIFLSPAFIWTTLLVGICLSM